MKRILIPFLAAFAFQSFPALAQDDPHIAPGAAAAQAWLTLNDGGQYDAAWNTSAKSFQAAVPRDTWLKGIAKLREPLGKLVSRNPASAHFAETLTGAPNGEYVTVEYDTQFENKKDAVETVTTQHEKDGSWKVMGYLLR